MDQIKRKSISKAMRQQVYNKYNGHCAYCGKEIALKDMQVDHIIPVMWAIYGTGEQRAPVEQMITDGSMDSLDNYMPTCRSCNFYKGMGNIESLRERIQHSLDRTCRSSFQTRLAMQCGIMNYKPWDGKFYFEKINEE